MVTGGQLTAGLERLETKQQAGLERLEARLIRWMVGLAVAVVAASAALG